MAANSTKDAGNLWKVVFHTEHKSEEASTWTIPPNVDIDFGTKIFVEIARRPDNWPSPPPEKRGVRGKVYTAEEARDIEMDWGEYWADVFPPVTAAPAWDRWTYRPQVWDALAALATDDDVSIDQATDDDSAPADDRRKPSQTTAAGDQ